MAQRCAPGQGRTHVRWGFRVRRRVGWRPATRQRQHAVRFRVNIQRILGERLEARHGLYRHADQSVYSGRWVRGLMDGTGEYKWPEGASFTTFVGQFRCGGAAAVLGACVRACVRECVRACFRVQPPTPRAGIRRRRGLGLCLFLTGAIGGVRERARAPCLSIA